MTVTYSPSVTAPTSSSSSSAAASTTGSSSALQTPTVDYNQFLTLLIAEIQNQDPTQPMDPTQSVTQLATISGVQQAMQSNATLSSLLTNSSLSQAEHLIGQKITSADGTTSGTVASVNVGASGSTATLTDGSTVSLANGVTIGS
jgi:flagellar basal-body rod modification protein FlgD